MRKKEGGERKREDWKGSRAGPEVVEAGATDSEEGIGGDSERGGD